MGGLQVSGITVALLGGALWLRHQQQTLEHLRVHNQQLVMQSEALQSRSLQWQSQAASLSAALNEQKQQQHTQEEMSEQTRQRLQKAVERSSCARQPVPVDIIRLQRDALNRRTMSN
ncbi:MAG: hypothetical protein ACRCR6_07460 [Plesiomonas sp.]